MTASGANRMIRELGLNLPARIMGDPVAKAKILGIELEAGKCTFIKMNGVQCGRPAGSGTTHLGQGCCYQHGGNGRPLVTGEQTRFNYPSLRDKIAAFSTDEHLKTTDDEIARLKVMQEEIEEMKFVSLTASEIATIKEMDKDLGKRVEKLTHLSGKVAKLTKEMEVILATDKLVSSKHNREVGQKYTLTIENIHLIFGQIQHHADSICKGCQKRKLLADAIEGSIVT